MDLLWKIEASLVNNVGESSASVDNMTVTGENMILKTKLIIKSLLSNNENQQTLSGLVVICAFANPVTSVFIIY